MEQYELYGLNVNFKLDGCMHCKPFSRFLMKPTAGSSGMAARKEMGAPEQAAALHLSISLLWILLFITIYTGCHHSSAVLLSVGEVASVSISNSEFNVVNE